MKVISLKRVKEKYRETPLWVVVFEHDDQREEFVSKSLKQVLLAVSAKTGIPYNATRNAA